MGSAIDCLLEAENYVIAAMASTDAARRADLLHMAARYRNRAQDLMAKRPGAGGRQALGVCDPCRDQIVMPGPALG